MRVWTLSYPQTDLQACGFRHEKIDFWDSVYGLNFRAIRRLAMAEPLVDVVEPEQIATNSVCVLTLDLNTMAKTESSFKVCALTRRMWMCRLNGRMQH